MGMSRQAEGGFGGGHAFISVWYAPFLVPTAIHRAFFITANDCNRSQ